MRNIAIIIILGEILGCVFDKNLLPPPSAIVVHIANNASMYSHHVFITLYSMILSIVVAGLISCVLAVVMFFNAAVSNFLQYVFVILQSIPFFLFAPFLVLIFKWTIFSIIAPSVLMILFPLTISVYNGLKSVPANFLDFFIINKMSAFDTLVKLRIPFGLPVIFNGLRIAASISALGTISGEWAGGQEGLGVLIQECRRDIDFLGMWGGFFCTIMLSMACYGAIIFVEKVMLRKYFFHIK